MSNNTEQRYRKLKKLNQINSQFGPLLFHIGSGGGGLGIYTYIYATLLHAIYMFIPASHFIPYSQNKNETNKIPGPL